MGTLGGSEVRLDTEMKIYGAGDEPNAFSLGPLRRLFDFGETRDAGVEGAHSVCSGDRDGDLRVVDAEDWHACRSLNSFSKEDRAWRRWILRIFSGRPLRRGGQRGRSRERFSGARRVV